MLRPPTRMDVRAAAIAQVQVSEPDVSRAVGRWPLTTEADAELKRLAQICQRWPARALPEVRAHAGFDARVGHRVCVERARALVGLCTRVYLPARPVRETAPRPRASASRCPLRTQQRPCRSALR